MANVEFRLCGCGENPILHGHIYINGDQFYPLPIQSVSELKKLLLDPAIEMGVINKEFYDNVVELVVSCGIPEFAGQKSEDMIIEAKNKGNHYYFVSALEACLR